MPEDSNGSYDMVTQAELYLARATILEVLPDLQFVGATLQRAGRTDEHGKVASLTSDLMALAGSLMEATE